MSNFKRVVNAERARESLTPRQGAFVREMVRDPSSATAAAIRAGYSKQSAKYSARQLLNNELIQSILAQHFIDKETEISEILSCALIQIRSMVDGTGKRTIFHAGDLIEAPIDAETQLKAIQTALQYAKIAKSVLGLDVSRKPDLPEEQVEVSEEDILVQLETEASRIRANLARRRKVVALRDGAEVLPR